MADFWKDDPDAVPIAELRRYARQQCKLRSQRVIADRIGIGRTTLNSFVTQDTNPHPRIRTLFQTWYWARTAACGEAASASLTALVDDLPPAIGLGALGRILDTLDSAYAEAGREPPGWIARLRTERTGGECDAVAPAKVNPRDHPTEGAPC